MVDCNRLFETLVVPHEADALVMHLQLSIKGAEGREKSEGGVDQTSWCMLDEASRRASYAPVGANYVTISQGIQTNEYSTVKWSERERKEEREPASTDGVLGGHVDMGKVVV
jgi:hypothetical protein